jgi:hypothetical protein
MAPKDELRRITTIRPCATGDPASFACPDERSAMALASVEVPAILVAPLRETLGLLYESTAEALHLALRAHAERRAPLEEVHRHRTRLAQLEALLGRLGWSPETAPELPGEPLVLSAPSHVLRDAIHGALIDAGERLAVACSACSRGELAPERVQRTAAEVIALDALLRQV